jgi:hypothetical protein
MTNNNHDIRAPLLSVDSSDDFFRRAQHPRRTVVAALIIAARTIRMVHEIFIHAVRHTQYGHLTMFLFLGDAQVSFHVGKVTSKKPVSIRVSRIATTFLAAAQSGRTDFHGLRIRGKGP